LLGYEWKIGKDCLLSANTKISYVGGKRYVPLTINDASNEDEYVYDYTRAYTEKLSDYFRLDFNINMKQNFKRFSLEWFVEVTNVTNHKNVWQKFYNASRNKEEYVYQYPIMPGGGFRVYF